MLMHIARRKNKMKKIVFIGSGSFTFTRNVVKDLLTFPAFLDAEIALVDIDPKRLEYSKRVCEHIKEKLGAKDVKITATADRTEALVGADGVLCTIFNGDLDIWRYDLEIPLRYGVSMNIGDTRSVAGIFRAARNIPIMLDICRDIEKYCPDALFLNYTNPMAMLCRAMQLHTNVSVTGLCHSVQGTIKMLSNWAGVPVDEVTYTCAGVNHQAFYTEIKHKDKDLYPILREKVKDPAIYDKERVRNEMFMHLGYYVTESSGHNSEYNAWFRKRPDLLKKYCAEHEGQGWNPGVYGYSISERTDRLQNYYKYIDEWMETAEITKDQRSPEYASEILNAVIGDGNPIQFNGNVINDGCIPNLPANACVEIPVVASRFGLRKCYVGNLPDEVAILVNNTARMENLAVDAIIEKDKQKLVRAVYMDPLCSAVLSLEEIESMCNELFEVNKDYLGDWK